MDFPFRLTDNAGVPITTLVKSDVVITKFDDPATIYSYTALTHIGYGQYVMSGINFAECKCKIYISSVEQTWLGVVLLGERATAFMNLTGNETIAGDKTFSGKVKGIGASTETEFMRKKEHDTDLATCVKNDSSQTLTNQFTFNTVCPISGTAPSIDSHLTRKDYVDGKIPFLHYYGTIEHNPSSPATVSMVEYSNTLGGALTITRSSAGVYDIASSALFALDESHIYTTVVITLLGTTPLILQWDLVSSSLLKLYVFDDAGTESDAFSTVNIEIKVFEIPTP